MAKPASFLKRIALNGLCSIALVQSLAPAVRAADANYEKGVACFNAKDFAQAAKCFEAAMRRNPADSNALYYDAQSYDQLGENVRATTLYQHCINIFPTSCAATYAQRILNSHRAVVTHAAAVKPEKEPASVGVSEDPIGELIKKGNAFDEQGNKAGAERSFLDALNLAEKGGSSDPKICDSLQALGDINAEKGNLGLATRYYQRELQMRERMQGKNSPDLAKRMTKQAEVYQRDGDLTTAEELFRRSADIYQSEYDKADRAGTRLVTIRENLTESLVKLAAVLRAQKRFPEATSIDNQIRTYQIQN